MIPQATFCKRRNAIMGSMMICGVLIAVILTPVHNGMAAARKPVAAPPPPPVTQSAAPTRRPVGPVSAPKATAPAAANKAGPATLAAPAGATASAVESEEAAEPEPEKAAFTPDPQGDAPARLQYGSDESIYVVQPRPFSKKGRFELAPLFFTSMNPKFVGYVGGALSAAYHVRENLAVEVVSSIPYGMYSYFSNLVEDVYKNENLTPEAVDLKHMRYFGSASVQLSALYGKFRLKFFKWSTLIDYDAYLLGGLGVAQTKEACADYGKGDCSSLVGAELGLRKPDDVSDAWKLTGNVGGGMRFFFTEHFGLRLEVRDIIYGDKAFDSRTNKPTTDVRNNLLFFLGLSVLI